LTLPLTPLDVHLLLGGIPQLDGRSCFGGRLPRLPGMMEMPPLEEMEMFVGAVVVVLGQHCRRMQHQCGAERGEPHVATVDLFTARSSRQQSGLAMRVARRDVLLFPPLVL